MKHNYILCDGDRLKDYNEQFPEDSCSFQATTAEPSAPPPPLSNVTSHCGYDEISETMHAVFQIQKWLGSWNVISEMMLLKHKIYQAKFEKFYDITS